MLTLVTGGRRSGKSRHAAKLAAAHGARVVVVVTGQATDAEMARRIAAHQSSRPTSWQVVEAFEALESTLVGVAKDADVVLLDCLSMYVSYRLCEEVEGRSTESAWVDAEQACLQECTQVVDTLANLPSPAIVVTHEVGEGLVSLTTMGRVFADLNGVVNQQLAQRADRVILMRVGLPQIIKTEVADGTVHNH